eukprot:jgi/Galph1/2054/GphlegSOOS_G770.1
MLHTSPASTVELPSAATSCFLSALCATLLFSTTQLGYDFFRSSPSKTILGGLVCSLFYCCCMIIMGNVEDLLSLPRVAGYLEGENEKLVSVNQVQVVLCLLTSLMVAATIHPVCITSCFIMCIVFTIGFHVVANDIYFQSTVTNKKRK